MKKLVVPVGALALTLVLTAAPINRLAAEETGVAGIHSWVKIGRRTCLADHFHTGNGNGASLRMAQAAAIRSWTDFTAWEYGGSWGRYSLAMSKSMKCERSSGGYSCTTDARPCRSY